MAGPSPSPSLTLFFIVEPPAYLYMACHLAASIRKYLPPEVRMIGYCPRHRWAEMEREPLEVLRRLRCEILPIEAEGRFDPPYPHGNKILATLEPKDTDFAAFLDTDMMFLRPCTVAELVSSGQIGLVPAGSMRWAPQTVWDGIYGTFGIDVPKERITLMRDKRLEVVPYFNAGLVVIDERWRSPEGKRFAEVWMDCAERLDRTGIDSRRPYLDQMTLPVAVLVAGMTWNILPERYNYSINGLLRGKPLPKDADVTLLHYRGRTVLADAGMKERANSILADQVGTRRVRWIFDVPPPVGIAPPPEPKADPPPVAPPADPPDPVPGVGDAPVRPIAAGPDPSKARMAAVTTVKGDHALLRRWVNYHGRLLGRENLYILRHGPDAEIDRIAAGANLIHLPDSEDQSGLDHRRWETLSQFTSGLTLYYNWVICTGVDEIVAPDPATGLALPEYLDALFDQGTAPQVISPLGVELLCPSPPVAPDPAVPLLSVWRHFRLKPASSKPCITRKRIAFSVGGQGSTVADVTLDPRLYLFHLRFADKAGDLTLPGEERSEFPEVVQMMRDGRSRDALGYWAFPGPEGLEVYRLPERFGTLF